MPQIRHHMCASVEWLLRNKAFRCLTDDDGRPMAKQDAKAALLTLREQGVRVIPVGTRCAEFSDETGCPGHPLEKES